RIQPNPMVDDRPAADDTRRTAIHAASRIPDIRVESMARTGPRQSIDTCYSDCAAPEHWTGFGSTRVMKEPRVDPVEKCLSHRSHSMCEIGLYYLVRHTIG